jgi:hypothetical protein
MNKIIDKLKSGSKICAAALSPDCLLLAPQSEFVGKSCKPCYKVHAAQYYKSYNTKARAAQQQAYGGLQFNKKDLEEINEACESDDDESEDEGEDEEEDEEDESEEDDDYYPDDY